MDELKVALDGIIDKPDDSSVTSPWSTLVVEGEIRLLSGVKHAL